MMKSYISKYARGNVKGALLLSAVLALSANLQAQDLQGKVIGNDGQPVANVVISMPGKGAVRTDANGMFTIKDCKENVMLTFRHEGYFNKTEHLKKHELGSKSLYTSFQTRLLAITSRLFFLMRSWKMTLP